jgi:hypothetical protein
LPIRSGGDFGPRRCCAILGWQLSAENLYIELLTAYVMRFSQSRTMGAGVDHRVFLPLVLRNR